MNTGTESLPPIVFRNDTTILEKKISEITKEHKDFEVYNVMNLLFEQTIPHGYIFKVSQIVKICSEMM